MSKLVYGLFHSTGLSVIIMNMHNDYADSMLPSLLNLCVWMKASIRCVHAYPNF